MNKNGKPQKNCQICVLLKKTKKCQALKIRFPLKGLIKAPLHFDSFSMSFSSSIRKTATTLPHAQACVGSLPAVRYPVATK